MAQGRRAAGVAESSKYGRFISVTIRPETIALFSRYNVFNERELQSRFNIQCEGYIKTVLVEARLTAMMAHTMILPAAPPVADRSRQRGHIQQIRRSGYRAASGGAKIADRLNRIAAKAIVDLDHATAHHAATEPLAHARHVRDGIIPAMNQVRASGSTRDADRGRLMALPSYREMLFIK